MNADDILTFLKSRRSIRRYSDHPVAHSLLERLIEAACWAPSNHNRQGWKFIVLENRNEIDALAEQVRCALSDIIDGLPKAARTRTEEILHYATAFNIAPAVILVMHKRSPAVGREMLSSAVSELVSGEAMSAAMAVQNLLLAAYGLGLGTCVMTAPLLAGEVWRSLQALPAGFIPTCLVTVGYPLEDPEMPPRKTINHVMEYGLHE